MTGAVSTSAPTAVGVRAAIAGTHDCRWRRRSRRRGLPRRDRRHGRWSGRLSLAGLATGCSVSKRRATGPTSTGQQREPAQCRPPSTHSKIDAFGLFTGQVGYAVNNVLFYVKGGAAVTSDSTASTKRVVARRDPLVGRRPTDDPLGSASIGVRPSEYAFASELVGSASSTNPPVHAARPSNFTTLQGGLGLRLASRIGRTSISSTRARRPSSATADLALHRLATGDSRTSGGPGSIGEVT